MSTYRFPRFARPDVLRAVHPARLCELLDPFRDFLRGRGLDWPPLGGPSAIDHDALVDVLLTPGPDTPRDLADALYFVHELATPRGMDALIAEFTLERLGCSFLELAPADVAVRAWLADRRLLERKHAELFAARPRQFQYFQARPRRNATAAPFVPPTAEQLLPLERQLEAVFEQKGRGRGVRVFAYPHAADCLFLVRHADPYRREGTLDGAEQSSVLYRPLRFDVVVYDPRTAALRVHAQTKWETTLYRGAFGQHVFGGIDHFSGRGRYTLEPLRAAGGADAASCLACADVPGIRSVELTEVHLSWGGEYDEVEVYRARNVFAALRRRRRPIPAGPKITRATFAVRFRGARYARPLTIAPPNVAQYARDEDAPLVDHWLALRGFIPQPLPEALPDGPDATDDRHAAAAAAHADAVLAGD